MDASTFLRAVEQGGIHPDTFELLDTEGADLPSLGNRESLEEYLADAYATKEEIRETKRRGLR